MELIRDLEQIFKNLNATLNSRAKVYAFYINFNNSYNRINTKIFNSLEEKKYENGLNECRDKMLKQLIQKRDEQLEEVNEFLQSGQQKSVTQLKSLHKCIKQNGNYAAFAKGWISVYESILFRSKLANPLKLAELEKYSRIMRIDEQVSLAKVKHLFNPSHIPYRFVHVLPFNRIFLYCPYKSNMVILNKSGDLIRYKKLENGCSYVQANATNIIVFDRSNRIVEIYNFKLELVHSIRLEETFANFKLNNYDIAFGDQLNRLTKITCYNFKTTQSKKNEICLNQVQLGLKGDFYLVGLNDRFIFIGCYDSCKTRSAYHICLLNRRDNNNLFKYLKSEYGDWIIYNDQICLISRKFYKIYELDGSVQREPIKNVTRIEYIYLTSNYRYLYSRRLKENNLILKLQLY